MEAEDEGAARGQKLGNRWDKHIESFGKEPPLPEIIEGKFLIGAFRDLGLSFKTGMGEFPLAYSEIEAYGRASGGLTPREVTLLRRMSVAYCFGRHRGRDPWELPPQEEDWDPDFEDWKDESNG
jgi:hypothetical protein